MGVRTYCTFYWDIRQALNLTILCLIHEIFCFTSLFAEKKQPMPLKDGVLFLKGFNMETITSSTYGNKIQMPAYHFCNKDKI